MSDINDILEKLNEFTEERDWSQFHNSKDLAIAISIEANELLEIFLWKKAEDVNPSKIKEELADVLMFCFLLAQKNNLDIKNIILEKIESNGEKYPINKSKGTSRKYNEL